VATLSDYSEDELTARFKAAFGPAPADELWTGDDAAVFAAGPRLVMTVDVMTEHTDFELSWASGEDVGFKLVAVNVSDVAAMGATPTKGVATLNVFPELELGLLDDVVRGMATAAHRWGIDIVGGDISRATELSLSLTLLGELDGEPVRRSTARAGDAICVTGTLGGAAAGLTALRAGLVSREVVEAEIAQPSGADALAILAVRQLRPVARLEESRSIAKHGATAMIDISDGLAIDLNRLLEGSGLGCEVAASAIPIDPEIAPAMDRLPQPVEPAKLALTGGEDFELLFTIDPDRIPALHESFDRAGATMSLIGRTTDGERNIDGEPLTTWMEGSWDHLRAR